MECVRRPVGASVDFVPPHDVDAYLYIRFVLFGSSGSIALTPNEGTILAIMVLLLRPFRGSEAVDGVVLDDFDRAVPQGMGAYKIGGNYAPVWRNTQKSNEMGFRITLHLDSTERNCIEKFSTSGFVGHMNGNGPAAKSKQARHRIQSCTAQVITVLRICLARLGFLFLH